MRGKRPFGSAGWWGLDSNIDKNFTHGPYFCSASSGFAGRSAIFNPQTHDYAFEISFLYRLGNLPTRPRLPATGHGSGFPPAFHRFHPMGASRYAVDGQNLVEVRRGYGPGSGPGDSKPQGPCLECQLEGDLPGGYHGLGRWGLEGTLGPSAQPGRFFGRGLF